MNNLQIDQWLVKNPAYAETDQQAALELDKCARIIKGKQRLVMLILHIRR